MIKPTILSCVADSCCSELCLCSQLYWLETERLFPLSFSAALLFDFSVKGISFFTFRSGFYATTKVLLSSCSVTVPQTAILAWCKQWLSPLTQLTKKTPLRYVPVSVLSWEASKLDLMTEYTTEAKRQSWQSPIKWGSNFRANVPPTTTKSATCYWGITRVSANPVKAD